MKTKLLLLLPLLILALSSVVMAEGLSKGLSIEKTASPVEIIEVDWCNNLGAALEYAQENSEYIEIVDFDNNGVIDIFDNGIFLEHNGNQSWCEAQFNEGSEPDINESTWCGRLYLDMRTAFSEEDIYNPLFDYNKDGVMNLADISIFAQNIENETWCEEQYPVEETEIEPVIEVLSELNETENETSFVEGSWCYMLEWEIREVINGNSNASSLTDFNNDNVTNLADIAIFASESNNETWCKIQFGEAEEINYCLMLRGDFEAVFSGEMETNQVTDLNDDNVTNLADIAIFVPQFFAENLTWCETQYQIIDEETNETINETEVNETEEVVEINTEDLAIGGWCYLLEWEIREVINGNSNASSLTDFNNDNVTNLADISIFSQNMNDEAWCEAQFGEVDFTNWCVLLQYHVEASFRPGNTPSEYTDFNDDGRVDLSDISIFTRKFFEDDQEWCEEQFETEEEEEESSSSSSSSSSSGGGSRHKSDTDYSNMYVIRKGDNVAPEPVIVEEATAESLEASPEFNEEEDLSADEEDKEGNLITGAVTGDDGSNNAIWLLALLLIVVVAVITYSSYKLKLK